MITVIDSTRFHCHLPFACSPVCTSAISCVGCGSALPVSLLFSRPSPHLLLHLQRSPASNTSDLALFRRHHTTPCMKAEHPPANERGSETWALRDRRRAEVSLGWPEARRQLWVDAAGLWAEETKMRDRESWELGHASRPCFCPAGRAACLTHTTIRGALSSIPRDGTRRTVLRLLG